MNSLPFGQGVQYETFPLPAERKREPPCRQLPLSCMDDLAYALSLFPEGDFHDLHFHHSVADFGEEAEKSADQQGLPVCVTWSR